MNFKFAKVEYRHPHLANPIQHGWMLSIETIEDLMHYDDSYGKGLLAGAFIDYCGKVTEENGYVRYKQHLANNLAVVTSAVAEAKGMSFVAALGEMSERKYIGMLNSLPVFVNRNGGYFPQDENCAVLETSERKWRWPADDEQQPRYLQWPNGTHWYCKVGPDDVEVDGKMKWDTRAEAEAAYKKWLQEKF